MSTVDTDANLGPPPNMGPGGQRSGSGPMDTEIVNQAPMGMKPVPTYPRTYSSYPPHYATRPPHPIQSVVTTSFSMDEEREDGSSRLSGHHAGGMLGQINEYRSPMEDRHHDFREPSHHLRSPSHGRDMSHHGREPPHYGMEMSPAHETDHGRLRRPPSHDMSMRRPARIPQSPASLAGSDRPSFIQRTHSAGTPSSFRGQGPLKRSFWHHARPSEESQASLPQEFMPPKRAKMSPGMRKEFVVTARPHPEEMLPSERQSPGQPSPRPAPWFNRALSWDAREDYYHRSQKSKPFPTPWQRHSPSSYRERDIAPHWSEGPHMPSPRARYSPSEMGGYERSPSWGPSRSSTWHQSSMAPEDSSWHPPQHRDEAESKHGWLDSRDREGREGEVRRQGTFESTSDDSFHQPPPRHIGLPPAHLGRDLGSPSRKVVGMQNSRYPPIHAPMDSQARHGNFGVVATDLIKDGPARLLALPEDRISLSETLCVVRENIEVFTATVNDVEAPAPGRKHAVVVGQVGLRCIHCRHTTRSSERVKRAVCYPSSIKRIYRTVIDMKLDHFLHCKFVPEGLKETLAALKANNTRSTGTTMQYFIRAATSLGMVDGPTGVRLMDGPLKTPITMSPPSPPKRITPKAIGMTPITSSPCIGSPPTDDAASKEFLIDRNNSMSSESTQSASIVDDLSEVFTGKTTLALPEDNMSLSPLRCFLREQVCAFSATEEDIAVRTPTTFSVSVGQVGIGCAYCLNQPAKLRLNRAVCFPFSIARIYQSVADIQRFHLSECKMVPADVKDKFLSLQSASSKGSKGLATRQYWVTSAKKIGLVDTSRGIRFGRDPSLPEKKAVSLDILAQVASNVTTVNKPLVLPEDKPYIAEFLYVVMEQLQPCRFTEADRNKRRLKDVGCIGVECKHCAGQVDGRKFFWSSVNAVESNFVSVHTHMMECRAIPAPLKEKLGDLKELRKEQTAALKTGSQKAFFSRVWKRLHGDDEPPPSTEDEEKEKAADLESTSTDMDVEEKENGDQDKDHGATNQSPPSSPKVESANSQMAIVSV